MGNGSWNLHGVGGLFCFTFYFIWKYRKLQEIVKEGGLTCCSLWDHKESDLATEQRHCWLQPCDNLRWSAKVHIYLCPFFWEGYCWILMIWVLLLNHRSGRAGPEEERARMGRGGVPKRQVCVMTLFCSRRRLLSLSLPVERQWVLELDELVPRPVLQLSSCVPFSSFLHPCKKASL